VFVLPFGLPAFDVVARLVYGHNFAFPSSVGLAVMLLRLRDGSTATTTEYDLFRRFISTYADMGVARLQNMPVLTAASTVNPYPQHHRRWTGLPDNWDVTVSEAPPGEPLVVLTPSYPHINSCHTVCQSSLRAFVKELARAKTYLQTAVPLTTSHPWRYLVVRPPDFLATAAGAVVITAAASTARSLLSVAGLAESKLRHLWYCAEAAGLDARLYPERLEHVDPPLSHPMAAMFVMRVEPGGATSASLAAHELEATVRRTMNEFSFFTASVPPETAGKYPDAAPMTTQWFVRGSDTFEKLRVALAKSHEDSAVTDVSLSIQADETAPVVGDDGANELPSRKSHRREAALK
jgi:hypothetical protein